MGHNYRRRDCNLELEVQSIKLNGCQQVRILSEPRIVRSKNCNDFCLVECF